MGQPTDFCYKGLLGWISNTSNDFDGDGLSDDKDECPMDPEDFDGYLDEDGCPEIDNDNDGVLDQDE